MPRVTIGSPYNLKGIPSQYPNPYDKMVNFDYNSPDYKNMTIKNKGKNKGKYKGKNNQEMVFTTNVVRDKLKQNYLYSKNPSPLVLNRMPGGKSRKRRNKQSIKSKPNKRKTFRKKRVHCK